MPDGKTDGDEVDGEMSDGGMMDGGMMDGGMMGAMGLWMLLWALIGVALLALAVVGVIWLVRRTAAPQPGTAPDRESPEELLRRRYAAGEIEDEEYERRQARLL